MTITTRAWRSLIGLLLSMQLIAIVPCATGAEPASPVQWSIQPTAEELQLLQQSLSITELDKEIDRISVQEASTAKERSRTEAELQTREAALEQKREQAGRVLRAYYIGERDMMLQAVLSADQLQDMFQLFEYFQILFQSDQDIMNDYKEQTQALRQTRDQHMRLERELSTVRTQLIDQRDRLKRLQQKLDADLSASSDPKAMNALIQEFTTYWQNVGLYEVRHYFRALANAMNKLPDFVKNSGSLSIEGTNYTITVKEEQLNQFLREQDPMFETFAFQFKEGMIAAEGSRSGMSVRIEGHYTIESEPENRILFHVDRMLFNGLELPESTRTELEQKFDLGFYPKQLVSFIEAKEVTIEDKSLTVKLALSW